MRSTSLDELPELYNILDGDMSDGYIVVLKEKTQQFKNELERYVGIGHAAALSSGTAAIHLALKAAGIDAGDIVFCLSFTFPW